MAEHPKTPPHMALAASVKAMNDPLVPEGLVPSVLFLASFQERIRVQKRQTNAMRRRIIKKRPTSTGKTGMRKSELLRYNSKTDSSIRKLASQRVKPARSHVMNFGHYWTASKFPWSYIWTIINDATFIHWSVFRRTVMNVKALTRPRCQVVMR